MIAPPEQLRRLGRRHRRGGFTFIEVLATIMLLAIVMPVVMRAVAISTDTARSARARTEAGGLAEAKLAELVATGEWQSGVLGGDFGSDWPGYTWSAEVQDWSASVGNDNGTDPGNTVNELDMHVTWRTSGGEERTVTLSTLVYQSNPDNQSSGTSSGSAISGSSSSSSSSSSSKK